MSFASARFEPEPPPYDRAAIEAHLDALPHAFPSRLPPGVLVRLREADVLIDQRAGPDALARGRELVAWLLGRGGWRVVTEAGDLGRVTSADPLYPGPLPNPASLGEDPLASPPPSGRTWRWEGQEGALAVHLPSGAVAFDELRGQLDAQGLGAFAAAVEGLVLEEIWARSRDGTSHDRCLPGLLGHDAIGRVLVARASAVVIDQGASDPGAAVAVRREDPDGSDDVAYFDGPAPPAPARALAALVVPWVRALAGWRPGDPLPAGFAALRA